MWTKERFWKIHWLGLENLFDWHLKTNQRHLSVNQTSWLMLSLLFGVQETMAHTLTRWYLMKLFIWACTKLSQLIRLYYCHTFFVVCVTALDCTSKCNFSFDLSCCNSSSQLKIELICHKLKETPTLAPAEDFKGRPLR